MASNCSTAQSVQYFIDVTAPVASSAGYFQITGKTHDSIGHTADTGAGNNSTQYTFTKNVTIRLDPSDTLPGSGLAAIRFSCDPTAPSASASGWESWAAGAGTKTFDLTDSAYGCNGSEGVKTVYAWAKDAAGNVSSAVSASITYDKTSPDFEVYSTPILLRAVPNYVYQLQNPTDAAGSAGFKDFSLTWIPESGPQTSYPDIPGNAPPFSKSFDPLARFVNEGCDANNDGKCVATIRITLEDRTGNIKTREQRLEIIPNTIATVTGDVSLTSNKTDAGTVADLDDRYTYSIHLRDANGNIIRPVPGILEIRGDWAFENNASFLGNEINPSNGDMRDGSIWYNWDDGNWTSSSNGNSASRVYV